MSSSARHSLFAPSVMDDIGLDGLVAAAKAHAIGQVGIRANRLDARVAAHLRAAGLDVGAWAVNDPDSVRHVLALAVEVFTTDIPTNALTIREAGSR